MNGLGSFGMMQKMYGNYTDKMSKKEEPKKAKEDTAANEAAKKKTDYADSYEKSTGNVAKTKETSVELSDKAKAFLDKLKEKYGDRMDIMVASYSTDAEASEIMSRGTKDYSVLIDPEELEKMASSEEEQEKAFATIDEATGNLEKIKKELEDSGEQVVNIGVSISSTGEVSYFAELEKMSEKQRERIEAAKEKKAEAAKDAAKEAKEAKEDPVKKFNGVPKDIKAKKTTVKADSIEELLDKIKNVNWDEIEESTRPVRGGAFDFSA